MKAIDLLFRGQWAEVAKIGIEARGSPGHDANYFDVFDLDQVLKRVKLNSTQPIKAILIALDLSQGSYETDF